MPGAFGNFIVDIVNAKFKAFNQPLFLAIIIGGTTTVFFFLILDVLLGQCSSITASQPCESIQTLIKEERSKYSFGCVENIFKTDREGTVVPCFFVSDEYDFSPADIGVTVSDFAQFDSEGSEVEGESYANMIRNFKQFYQGTSSGVCDTCPPWATNLVREGRIVPSRTDAWL
jgi:hypothetical protein